MLKIKVLHYFQIMLYWIAYTYPYVCVCVYLNICRFTIWTIAAEKILHLPQTIMPQQSIMLLGKVIKKTWPLLWLSGTLEVGISTLPLLCLKSSLLACTRSCSRTQPWGSNAVMRPSRLGTWLIPVKTSCVHDWIQVRPLFRLQD